MDDIDRIVAAIFAAAKCAGTSAAPGEFFEAYDYFMAMTASRDEAAMPEGAREPSVATAGRPAAPGNGAGMRPISKSENSGPPLSEHDARDLVNSTKWYHKFELRPGLVTPGVSPIAANDACDALGIPADLTGKRALDVGAWDGAVTFELERRGARAMALDIQDPTHVGFDTARKVLGSRAAHYQGSVYQLPYDEMTDLDLIVFRGVYYHLKYPILAFERCAMSLKMGGTLHFEGAALYHYVEDIEGRKANIDLSAAYDADIPLCAVYPRSFRGASNWFIPNRACLRGWIEAAGLEVEKIQLWTSGDNARLLGWARKVREFEEAVEHPVF